MTSAATVDELIDTARAIAAHRLTHGSTGNLSIRVSGGILVTPTGSSLATVQPEDLSLIDNQGRHLQGRAPSKEAFLHAAVLRARPTAHAVVHTHSTFSAAVSCLADLDSDDAIPPLTAYFAMRVGQVPLLPYHAPGDQRLEAIAERAAGDHAALLLSNHGPVVAGSTMRGALEALEELEETAKLFLLLQQLPTRPITAAERSRLLTPGTLATCSTITTG